MKYSPPPDLGRVRVYSWWAQDPDILGVFPVPGQVRVYGIDPDMTRKSRLRTGRGVGQFIAVNRILPGYSLSVTRARVHDSPRPFGHAETWGEYIHNYQNFFFHISPPREHKIT